MREFRVLEEELEYLGPVAIAMFVELDWITLWPMGWTKIGRRALSNGYGRWEGTRQRLPCYLEDLPETAAHWHRRRAKVPAGTNIPMIARQELPNLRTIPAT